MGDRDPEPGKSDKIPRAWLHLPDYNSFNLRIMNHLFPLFVEFRVASSLADNASASLFEDVRYGDKLGTRNTIRNGACVNLRDGTVSKESQNAYS